MHDLLCSSIHGFLSVPCCCQRIHNECLAGQSILAVTAALSAHRTSSPSCLTTHPPAQGSSSDWVLQWVCRSCGSSTSMQNIPALPPVSCSQCSTSAAIVFDRPTGRIVRFCVSCQLVVPHDGDSLPPRTPVPPAPALPPDNDPPSDWFSHGPSTRFPSLYRWGRGDPTPGSGTQSWLFCPLISLGLALA